MSGPIKGHPSRSFSTENSDSLFWPFVRKTSEDACWEWILRKSKRSYKYGRIHVNGEWILAHRYSFKLHNPSVEIEDLCVCHKCDNPGCVNPNHLFLGTISDNNHDRKVKGRTKAFKGSLNPFSKLTESQVLEIREMRKSMKIREISELTGIPFGTIGCIVSKTSWNHI